MFRYRNGVFRLIFPHFL